MTTSQILIEAIGYLGSTLVLVSFLMASVFKLRIVNTVGSCIFTVYALIIHSYPTAIMNACLVIINVYYLIKLSNTGSKNYDLVDADVKEPLVTFMLNKYKDDILKIFPGLSLDYNGQESCFVILHSGKPVGITVGRRDSQTFDILLDYTIREYRDFTIGAFLFSSLESEGINTFTYKGPDQNHKAYLKKVGFVPKDDYYIRTKQA